jgi:hypothetical protein
MSRSVSKLRLSLASSHPVSAVLALWQNSLTEHLDNDQRRIKFNSCFTQEWLTRRRGLFGAGERRPYRPIHFL